MADAKGEGDIELTVEETNKLREKLGLKPLETTSAKDKVIHADPRKQVKAKTQQEKFDEEVERKANKARNALDLTV